MCDLPAREWGLMLVFPTYLEQVEEVRCRGMDGDEVLVGFGCGCRKINYFEIFRSLFYVSAATYR
jgi:hypothetical protein